VVSAEIHGFSFASTPSTVAGSTISNRLGSGTPIIVSV